MDDDDKDYNQHDAMSVGESSLKTTMNSKTLIEEEKNIKLIAAFEASSSKREQME